MAFLVGKYDPAFTLASKAGGYKFAQGLSGAVQRANAELARITQDLVVDYLEQTIERPETSSGRLADVLRSSQNRNSSVNGFAVGFTDVLDREARYWRNIEEGTAGRTHYAREVSGYFRIPGLPTAAEGPLGKLMGPRPGRVDGRLLEMTGGRRPAPHFFIHDIRAHDFFYDAWTDLEQRNVIRSVYARNLREVIDPITERPVDWAGILEAAGL
ncbi:MAG: hypothetical protein ACXVYY_01455 [Oryzihumus sp.]